VAMTEAEWSTSTDPGAMLTSLLDGGSVSDRKLRLFACACCHHIGDLLHHPRSWGAIQVAERFVDGAATLSELAAAYAEASCDAGYAAAYTAHLSAVTAAINASDQARLTRSANAPDSLTDAEWTAQSWLLRDIAGPLPFRAVTIDPACLTWNHSTVPAIARRIYEGKSFHDLAILADALEDAGCTDAQILAHCRGGGPHVRGCWVVDLLLGRD
jgi:hypothetical protein